VYSWARFASDRSDAVGGLALLRRAGAPHDDDLVQLLEAFRPKPRPGLGRNQPCWCGSGRKYKMCHLGKEALPLEERAAWLYQKAGMHLEAAHWRTAMADAGYLRIQHLDAAVDPTELLSDGLIVDAVLFEGGGFEDFLAARGHLLPDDERLLAQQWLLRERSVYEVESVRPGQGLELRDLRSGDRYEVRERTASRSLKTGMLICTRVLPTGNLFEMYGGVEPIQLHQRDQLIALLDEHPEPTEIVEFLSRRLRPPAMQNTEGEPLVFCEATLRTPNPAAMAASLDSLYDRDESGEQTWFEHVTTQGMERIRATMQLDGDELRVETNSEGRYERILAAITGVQPEVELIGERRRGMDEIEPAEPESNSGATIDLTNPAIQEALQQFMRQQEQAWLDEPIPALAGVTPRQAAADPTRRPDLIRLLDSWPDEPDAIAMSPRRLRAALNLA
jgi:hypothetical protein